MSKFRLLVVGTICAWLSGCTLENNCDNCPMGCNAAGNDCAVCNAHQCENGVLRLCKDDKTGYEDGTTECSMGCNDAGTNCKACDVSECKDGKLKVCKEDKSGYEEDVIDCQDGCNAEGTDCKDSCIQDSCRDGMLYRCTNGALSEQGEECPDIKDGYIGSCANATACKQCDDDNDSLRRRCISPTEYYVCEDGLWSDKKLTCPGGQFCNETADSCSNKLSTSCIDDIKGTGQLWTYNKGDLQSKPCSDDVSCVSDGRECGVCHNGNDTRCLNDVYYTCQHGIFVKTACTQGLGCHSVGNNGACNECTAGRCKDDKDGIGYIEECKDGAFVNSEKCQTENGTASCLNDIDCGECLNDSVRCDDKTLQKCQSGQWTDFELCEGDTPLCDAKSGECVPDPNRCKGNAQICKNGILKKCENETWKDYPCELGCYDKHECNVCTLNETVCDGNILKTCVGNAWTEEECELKCENISGGAHCTCQGSGAKCHNDKELWSCVKNLWTSKPCLGGCVGNICYSECTPGQKKCVGEDLYFCNQIGMWPNANKDYIHCNNGCDQETNECIDQIVDCYDGTKCVNDTTMAICIENQFVDVHCSDIKYNSDGKCDTGKGTCVAQCFYLPSCAHVSMNDENKYLKLTCKTDEKYNVVSICSDDNCESCQ